MTNGVETTIHELCIGTVKHLRKGARAKLFALRATVHGEVEPIRWNDLRDGLVMPLYPVAERSEHFDRIGEVEALGFPFASWFSPLRVFIV